MGNWLDRIKELKQRAGHTNDALSAATGIPLGTLNKILSGVSDDPKLSTLSALAGIYNVTLDYIAFGDEASLSLSDTETDLIKKYRALDYYGREVSSLIIGKEFERISAGNGNAATAPHRAAILRYSYSADRKKSDTATGTLRIPLYHLPASAGRGAILDGNGADYITVTSGGVTLGADFALRVSGDSMEPRYLDGDIILVHEQPQVGIGELGIFVCDDGGVTEGYFKRYGGDRLISLNEAYDDIYLNKYQSVSCRGKVIGRLPRKTV